MEIHVYAYDIDFEAWEDKKLTNFIYLHGDLMERNGFDLVALSSIPEKKGIYPVIVHFADGGIETNAKLFYWKADWKDRGLIVSVDDEEHIKDAQEKYDRNAEYI